MTCFSPNQGYERIGMTKNGKYMFTTKRELARTKNGFPIPRTTPCRKCEGCRWSNSREWAVKICHEADMYKHNSFITLTYDDDHMPLYGSLDYENDWRKFINRLRGALPVPIRYFMVGEYGDLNLRPHYHAIIFGWNFPDVIHHMDRNGIPIFRSPLLESVWTTPHRRKSDRRSLGFSSVGDVNFSVAAYVARYQMKKLIGVEFDGFEEYSNEYGEILTRPRINERYVRYNQETGDKVIVAPERHLQSNGGGSSGNGGLGKAWFDKYAFDTFYETDIDGNFRDYVHMPNGMIVRPPKYYDKLLERVSPEMLESIKKSRQDHMLAHANEFTPERLAAKRAVLNGKLKHFTRPLGI